MNATEFFVGRRVLVTGGTGSLGRVLVRRLLGGELGLPDEVVVLSRDEAKQHFMRLEYAQRPTATDDIVYKNGRDRLSFRIGDIRDGHAVVDAVRDVDIVINAAALKQVPTCEYFPFEAIRTNIEGAENIVRAIREHALPVRTVVGISTDKACKPVNTMGMTKALQERLFIQANLRCPHTRFVCVRYGNVLASRGSVIPLFHDQIKHGGPLTVTTPQMTRFLITLDDAVDTVFAALLHARPGETFVPDAASARVVNVARALIGTRPIDIRLIGVRPGEKTHEIMVSEEEAGRTVRRQGWYAIQPLLPELLGPGSQATPALSTQLSSADNVLSLDETKALLAGKGLTEESTGFETAELLGLAG